MTFTQYSTPEDKVLVYTRAVPFSMCLLLVLTAHEKQGGSYLLLRHLHRSRSCWLSRTGDDETHPFQRIQKRLNKRNGQRYIDEKRLNNGTMRNVKISKMDPPCHKAESPESPPHDSRFSSNARPFLFKDNFLNHIPGLRRHSLTRF